MTLTKIHGDKTINKVLNQYNKIAEYLVTSDMVANGAYDFSAKSSINGVDVMIYSSTGIAVDYHLEAVNDATMYPVFRDFCKAVNANLTNEEIEIAWTEMRTFEKPTSVAEIKAYNEVDVGGIECTYYFPQSLNNGTNRYTLKTISREYK